MSLWLFIAVLAILTAAVLTYSSREKTGTSALPEINSANERHFRVQLAEIEADVKSGKLDTAGAEAAKAELARELMHHRAYKSQKPNPIGESFVRFGLPLASLATVVLALGVYAMLGTPEQPSSPMASRTVATAPESNPLSFAQAIERVELQLAATPDDLNGWLALAPAYMQATRYADAANAYRRILELSVPTPDSLTDLAEALLLSNNGNADPEIIGLLETSIELEPGHTRARFYLASEATQRGDWDSAVVMWNELLDLTTGAEPWINVAQSGLSVALARGVPPVQTSTDLPAVLDDPEQAELIRSMVAGLAERLGQDGGSIEEWTRLVRSHLVLGEIDMASQAYSRAVVAYPDETGRGELELIAQQAGIIGDNE